MRKILLVFFLLLFGFPQRGWAASLTIDNLPSSIGDSDEFVLDVSLSCSGCSDSYLRGVFYESGTSYFGYTQDNSGNFSNASGSNCATFFKVASGDLNSGSWSGKIKFRPDPQSTFYKGSGTYYFKVGRYTSSCSSPSTWSSESSIVINSPVSPTEVLPTENSSSSKTPTPSRAPTPSKSPTATKAPTSTKNPTTTKAASVKGVSASSSKNLISARIGTSSSSETLDYRNSPSPSQGPKETKVLGSSRFNYLLFSIPAGALLLILTVFIVGRRHWEQIITWLNS